MVRIVFASDSHLNKHYARMTPDQLEARRAALRRGWETTVERALEMGAHVYIHGGDLFDAPNPRAAELTAVARGFQRLADAGIHAVTVGGNHDIPRSRHGGEAPQHLLAAVRLAEVFATQGELGWWTVDTPAGKVAVGGLPSDPTLAPGEDPLARVAVAPPPADVVLLVTHYGVEGTPGMPLEEPLIARSSIAALAGLVHVVLCGHIHARHDFAVAGVRVVFPGPTERMSFGELDVRPGFVELTAARGAQPGDPPHIHVRHVALEPQPMRREVVRANALPEGDPTGWLLERVAGWSDKRQILQLRLEGELAQATYRALRLDEVWRAGAAANFYFDLDRHGLTVDRARPAATGEGRASPRTAIRRAADLRGTSASAEERALLAEARDLALRRYGAAVVTDE